MNLAHIHLLLNHIPIIAVPIGLLFLLRTLWTSNIGERKFAYLFLFLTSLSVIAVYLTGEPAEEVIEHLPGITEAIIEPHEEAGLVALVLTLIMGATSFVALFFKQDGTQSRIAKNFVIATAVIATGTLSYTAYLGGQIRHTEIRENSSSGPTNE